MKNQQSELPLQRPIRLHHWGEGDPPAPFELGEVPTDYGVGRAAYHFVPLKEGEENIFKGSKYDGMKLAGTIYRGDYWLEFPDGSTRRLGVFAQFTASEILQLIRDVAKYGLEEVA